MKVSDWTRSMNQIPALKTHGRSTPEQVCSQSHTVTEGFPGKQGVKAMCSWGLRREPKLGFILEKNHCIHQLVVFAEIAWT